MNMIYKLQIQLLDYAVHSGWFLIYLRSDQSFQMGLYIKSVQCMFNVSGKLGAINMYIS
jgi:hypothetical protein